MKILNNRGIMTALYSKCYISKPLRDTYNPVYVKNNPQVTLFGEAVLKSEFYNGCTAKGKRQDEKRGEALSRITFKGSSIGVEYTNLNIWESRKINTLIPAHQKTHKIKRVAY